MYYKTIHIKLPTIFFYMDIYDYFILINWLRNVCQNCLNRYGRFYHSTEPKAKYAAEFCIRLTIPHFL